MSSVINDGNFADKVRTERINPYENMFCSCLAHFQLARKLELRQLHEQ